MLSNSDREILWATIEAQLDQLGLKKSCINCEHFDQLNEGCLKAEGKRPPARVIARGCDQWDEEIPF